MPSAPPKPHSKPSATFFRSSPEWKAWAEGLAEHDRAPSLSHLIERAMLSYAQSRGFDRAAPRR